MTFFKMPHAEKRALTIMATAVSANMVLIGEAHAQDVGDRFQAEPIASVNLVLAPGIDGRENGPRASQAALGEIALGARAEYILDNGAEIGGRLVWRVQRDHPNRPGGSGSPLPLGGTAIGAFSGLSSSDSAFEAGPRGSLETAFLYIRGGYGELSVGRDTGVAARFQEGNVDVFDMARASDTRLDPTGLNTINTRANLTGPAEKLSYTTPRIVGLRAGLSYTPEADRSGLDRNPVFGADGLTRPAIKDAWEVALNGSHRFRESGLRVRGGLAFASADLDPPVSSPGVSGRVDVFSAGGEIRQGPVTVGGSFLTSDDGVETGDYSAWTTGISYDWNAWTGSISIGRADAESVGIDGESLSVGISRDVGKYATFTFGYQDIKASSFRGSGGNTGNHGGIVIELSLSL